MLKPLVEHEAERATMMASLNNPAPCRNGIACPECGTELFDSCPLMMLTSNPPKKTIHCEACDYRGYRTA